MKFELKNKYWKILIFCLFIIILIGSFVLVKGRPKELIKVRISVAEQPVFALIFVANSKGYFKEEGLDVELRRHKLGRDALADVMNGDADFATAFDVPVINHIQKGDELGVLTTLHTSSRNQVVAAVKSRGIRSADDLRGKRIAMTKDTSTELFLSFYLLERGVSINEVKIVSLEPDSYIDNLINEEVDAVVLFSPYTYLLKKELPDDQVTWLYSEVFPESSLLVGKKEFIENNEGKTIKVLRALYKAEKYVKTNKEETIRLVEEFLPNYESGGLREDWEVFDFSLGLSNMNMNNMEKQVNYFRRKGAYFGDAPYLRDNFMPLYLETIKPEGVTLF